MKKKISFSAWKKYHDCPQLYKYHYIDRLRPESIGSPLVFGTAIDEALNQLLTGHKDPVAVFQDNFKYEDMQNVVWDSQDLDMDLFTDEQAAQLQGKPFEYMAWASMRIKGRVLIEEYERRILPLITKVIHVQKEIEGNPGFLDAVVEMLGFDGPVLLDHKTSKMPYKDEDADLSPQLAFYASREKIDNVAFVVMVKTIKKIKRKKCRRCSHEVVGGGYKTCNAKVKGKRCGGPWDIDVTVKPEIQLIGTQATPERKQMVEDSIAETQKMIDAGHFPRNLAGCKWMYGKPCPYINTCWKNDHTGLTKKEKK